MNDEAQDPYLWDRSGEPDPEIVRLEQTLSSLRHQGEPPVWPAHTRRMRHGRQHRRIIAVRQVLLAAAALVLGFGLWFALGGVRGAWTVQQLAGAPRVDGAALEDDGVLRRGSRLVTDSVSRARIDVGRIGRVNVEPDTELELVASGVREHRLSLDRGTIHARIWAPPRFFYVDTPFAEAIDLGCAFTLQVDDAGGGLLRVTHGWVQFAYDGREAFIPQGAVGATRPGVGPGTPRYEDAPHGFAAALATLDFGPLTDAGRAPALDYILENARPKDALTLWHLLSRGSYEERARVFDRLSALRPPPDGVTRDAVLVKDRTALMQWWDSFDFEGTSFWSRVKQRF